MARKIVVIRPEPGLSETLEVAAEIGLPAQGIALSRAVPCEWDAPDATNFTAILAGSANAFRCGGAQLEKLKGLDVLAVGAMTAHAAREAGFAVAEIGSGGLQGLLDSLAPQDHKLLRLAGKERVSLDAPEGTEITSRIVYAMEQLPFHAGDAEELREGAIVLLFSAMSAAHFRSECERLEVDLQAITIAALGPRIADAAGEGWQSVHHAEKPDTSSILALAERLWQM